MFSFLFSVLDLSSLRYFPAYTDVNGTVQRNCAVKKLLTYFNPLKPTVAIWLQHPVPD